MGFWFESFFIELAIAVVSIVLWTFLYAKYKFKHWDKNNIQQLNPIFPLGDCTDIILKKKPIGLGYEKIYNTFKKKNEPFGGYYFMFRPELMLVDVDIIKQIMVKDFQHFTDRGTFSDEKNDPLTGHLFSLGGTKWKTLRTKLTPTFTSGKMKMMFHTLVSCSDELKNILEEKERLGEPLEIKEYLARFTTDVIASCAFGIDCNCLKNPNTDFRKYGSLAFQPQGIDVFKQLGAFLSPEFFMALKIPVVNKNITNFFLGVVSETIKYREENNIFRKDFMQLMLQLKNQGKIDSDNLTDDKLTDGEVPAKNGHDIKKSANALSVEMIAAQCFIFFVAAFETSSTTMTFCLYELVRNPDIQEKVRKEINTVLAKHGGKLTYEAIMDMHYMEKVINETLRKYPPIPFLMRKCTKDYPLPKSNYVIRKGDKIRISVLGLQKDPEFYPDPLKFDPERFSNEIAAKRHPFAFIPFGEGPRICIGLRFGMMQIKVCLSVLLKNYNFTLNSKTKEPLVMDPCSLGLSTVGGIWLDAHKVN